MQGYNYFVALRPIDFCTLSLLLGSFLSLTAVCDEAVGLPLLAFSRVCF
jgi:hypothetical protein